MIIARLFICPEHVYVDHHGQPAGIDPMAEVDRAELVAGRGVVGDRYFNRPEGHKGQVTFFSEEVYRRLQASVGGGGRGPGVFRRNILVRGADLNSLVGEEFEVGGLRFRGSEYCKPCYWMDEAFAPGTLAALTACTGGGLRARILSSGWLQSERAGTEAAGAPGQKSCSG